MKACHSLKDPPPSLFKSFLSKLSKFINLDYFIFFILNKKVKRHIRSRQMGMMLVEVVLMAVFLAAIAIATPYFFAQTQATMKSSSQTIGCQSIAQQALINTVSLGARLYGYKVNHSDNNLKYDPLFIKKNGTTIDDVGDGSELSFPPEKYKTLYKSLGVTPTIQDPKTNTGKDLIGSTYPFDLSTSVLLVNSVNALQYLYNSDNGFFTENGGMGKMYTLDAINPMSDGELSSLWEQYKDRFDLEDLKFYIKVAPIDLTTNEEMTSPPSQILTRPRFHNPDNAFLSPALNILGDENIGFEITVMLKYTRDNQEYTCEANQRFYHQGKTITKTVAPLPVTLTSLKTGANIDLKNNADRNTPPLTPAVPSDLKLASCDTHGSGYDDITLTVDFNGIGEGQQAGTVILCRMNSYCRSYGYNDSYNTCVTELGQWRRCHNITPAGSQSWTYSVNPINDQALEMTFSDMTIDRRYELDVGEFSIAGYNLRIKNVAKFYIDAKRPEVTLRRITNNLVGKPDDAQEGRNYGHPHPPTFWRQPLNSAPRWLQCRTGTVEFAADLTDQFVHNLYRCDITGKREDGTNKGTGVATSPTQTSDCGGELSVTQHGRYTITFAGGDTCGTNALSTKDLVWDYDDPNTFAPQSFTQDPEWLYSSSKDAYPIETEVPGTGAGKFPKHYSVDCDDNYQSSNTRQDGDGEKLECDLSGSVPAHDDGCNLSPMGITYYHVCGAAQTGCNHSKEKKWGVYTPHGESCANVWCEPNLSCCDASSGTCNGVADKECGSPATTHCTNPKGGTQTSADEILSGCPPLGLNDCSYQLPCKAINPGVLTGPTSYCSGKRQGVDTCSFPADGTCNPHTTGWHSSMPSLAGTCSFPGTSYTESCTAGSTSQCVDTCSHWDTCYQSCPQTVPCEQHESCTTKTIQVDCNEYQCNYGYHGCHDYDYMAVPNTCSRTFSGTCGHWSSGGCSAKSRGGGTPYERCDVRNPVCCDSTVRCCPGDSYPSNLNCPAPPPPPPPGTSQGGDGVCDSSTKCCSGDTHPSNPHCTPTPPCDSSKKCCTGDTPQSNSKCKGPRKDGKCNNNGCNPGSKKMNSDGSWSCLGEGGGADVACPKPCDKNVECCKGKGQCDKGKGENEDPVTDPDAACTCGRSGFQSCGNGCQPENHNTNQVNVTVLNIYVETTVHTWDCVKTGYQTAHGCNGQARKCVGPDDGCIAGDGIVDGQHFIKSCTTNSYNSGCQYAHCDRRTALNCKCRHLSCPADPPNQ